MVHRSATTGRSGYMLNLLLIMLLLCSGGCASTPASPGQSDPGKPDTVRQESASRSARERRSADYVVLVAEASDSYESLARAYLGDPKLSYLIEDYNKNERIVAGKQVVIPLQPVNPGGLAQDGYQTVPILSYHQFSQKPNKNNMFVTEAAFDQQMAYLKKNGYTVITLKQFMDFIEYRRRPPQKSVLITIDDGWKSTLTIAYPILRKYGFSAVLFVYTDLVKSKQNSAALSWDEVRQLKESGVFELGAHTITHSDLSKIPDDQLLKELKNPLQIIAAKTGTTPEVLAYPYGIFNDKVVEAVKKAGYRAAFSVLRGGNAFYYSPFSLNRSMIKGENLEEFKKNLETFRQE